jgi:hypothetical protein
MLRLNILDPLIPVLKNITQDFGFGFPVSKHYTSNRLRWSRLFFGSYPKSVMALDTLWMLELTSQRGFRECAQHHVSKPGIPGNVEDASFFDSLGRNAGLPGRSELAPETESVPASLESGQIGRARNFVGRPNGASRYHGGLSVP